MSVWRKARRKPIVFEFREVEHRIPVLSRILPNDTYGEEIQTKEGTLVAVAGRDYIMRGVEGEVWPITKTVFRKTYEIIEEVGGQKEGGSR